jgi:beta-glucanase (GH16 family)
MLPTDNYYGRWPRSGEIDIMELLGNEPEKVYGTLIYGKPYEASSNTYSLYNEKTFSDDFHVFGLVWEPEGIYWYIDGQPFHYETYWYTSDRVNEFQAPFNMRFHLILNIAVGGSWPGRPDDSTVFSQFM